MQGPLQRPRRVDESQGLSDEQASPQVTEAHHQAVEPTSNQRHHAAPYLDPSFANQAVSAGLRPHHDRMFRSRTKESAI